MNSTSKQETSFYPLLHQTILFRNIEPEELPAVLQYLQSYRRSYSSGSTILHAGEPVHCICVVLSGSVTIEKLDLWGNRTILGAVGPGDLFAEVYAILQTEPLMVNACANENSEILFLDIRDLLTQKPHTEYWKQSLLHQLLRIVSMKNLKLSLRSFHTAEKSLRARIMSYLDSESLRTHSREFDIPFDRQQMADYLNVDRTALSKELSRMKKDGLLDFRRNHFQLRDRIPSADAID